MRENKITAFLQHPEEAHLELFFDNSFTDLKIIMRGLRETTYFMILWTLTTYFMIIWTPSQNHSIRHLAQIGHKWPRYYAGIMRD